MIKTILILLFISSTLYGQKRISENSLNKIYYKRVFYIYNDNCDTNLVISDFKKLLKNNLTIKDKIEFSKLNVMKVIPVKKSKDIYSQFLTDKEAFLFKYFKKGIYKESKLLHLKEIYEKSNELPFIIYILINEGYFVIENDYDGSIKIPYYIVPKK